MVTSLALKVTEGGKSKEGKKEDYMYLFYRLMLYWINMRLLKHYIEAL